MLNGLSVLKECAGTDDSNCDDVYADELLDDLDDAYDDTEELPDDLDYEDDMVNVIEVDEAAGVKYVMEMDSLYKLMESKNIDVYNAFQSVCECNNLDPNNVGIVIESDDEADDFVDEVKDCQKDSKTEKKKHKQVKEAYDFLKNLKNKGIKTFKKKSKNKNKKKK